MLAAAAPAQAQTTSYLSSTGDDTNDGLTAATPFATLQHAIDSLDTAASRDFRIVVAGGSTMTGVGNVNVVISSRGLSRSTVLIESSDNDPTSTSFSAAGFFGRLLRISGGTHVTVRGLSFRSGFSRLLGGGFLVRDSTIIMSNCNIQLCVADRKSVV